MPGRRPSQGCRTCVRRRVKCDETQPQCRRCQRANLLCDGPPAPTAQFQDETELVIARHTESRRNSSTVRQHTPPLTLRSQPSPYSENVYYTFFTASFFNTHIENHENDFHANKLWMKSALESPDHFPISSLALKCLTTGYFGSTHASHAHQHDGRTLYTSALTAIRDCVADPARCGEFDLLAAVCLLTIYEYTAATSETGWLEHLRGISTLFRLKGPEFFHTQPARSLFILQRMNIICGAMIWRERSFLEGKDWQDFLTQYANDECTRQTIRITNLLARIPGFIEDGLHAGFDQARRQWDELFAELDEWYEFWVTHLPEHLPQTKQRLPDQPELFESTLWYTRLEVAAAFCQYHATILLRHKWTYRTSPQQAEDLERHQTVTRPHALAICQSIPYFLLSEHSYSGAFYLLFPAFVACQAFQPEHPERQWILDVLARLAGDLGVAVAARLADQVAQLQ